MKINCIVLAGGKGRRLGRDKALETIGGRSLIERAVTSLGYFQGEIIVVADVARQDLGLEKLPRVRLATDTFPNQGPLSGIHGGLSVSDTFYNIVVACDMPFLNIPLLEYMAGQAKGYDAAVPRLDDGLEPLHAIYGKSCLKAIEAMFAEGDCQVHHLFERLNARYIEATEIDRFDPRHLSFFNINTKSALARARELAGN